jgi:hypothetical protein
MRKILIIVLIITFLAPITVYAQDQGNEEPSSSVAEGYNPDYNILPIILALFMFYLVTYLLYDNKNMKRRTFKQIWSLVLVGSFLFVGIAGVILSILADFNLVLPFDFNLLFWHVEAGIILAITIILHMHIHFKRFKEIINVNF